ncbi:MAG: GNVR domain-containing protein [Arenicellales bacterium]
MNLQQLWQIIKNRSRLLFLIVVIAVCTTYAFTKFFTQPFYTASTTLLLEFEEPGIDTSMLPAMLQEQYLTTQLEIMKSMLVAEKAVSKLGYAAMPRYKDNYNGTGSINEWVSKKLLKDLRVWILPKSRLIKMSFTSDDPVIASEVPNAFAEAFIEVVLRQNLDPVLINAKMLDERLANLRMKLKQAKDRLNAHQKEKNVLITEDKLNIEALQLETLSEKLAAVKADIQVLQSRLDQVNALKASDQLFLSLPEVMANRQIQALQSLLYEKKLHLAELSLKFGKNHPDYKSVVREISSLEKNIIAESKHVVSTFEVELLAAKDRAASLEKAKDIQKTKVIELKQDTSDLPVLLREAESAQRVYEKALAQVEENALLAQVKYTNVKILDKATIPEQASGPNVKKNILLSIMLGLFLGLALIVLLELKDRRVRSKEDVVSILGDIPLLGTLKEK